ncbi:MAG TPA: helix-turn-helix transcriptional regulator [Nocardioidaceae bacterium]|nr:helix-turn-helix transcriptional regulator [Nocardioidaceae bacterium]
MPDQTPSPIGRTHTSARRRRAKDPAYAEAARQLAPYEALARMVIRHRMANELSQEDLAKAMGTSNTAISRLESGQHRPGVETLEKLARVFKRQLIVGFADPIEDLDAEPIRASVADHEADLIALA